MLVKIFNHTHREVLELEAKDHKKAINAYSVNPVKKATAKEWDFFIDSVNEIERTYWIFK